MNWVMQKLKLLLVVLMLALVPIRALGVVTDGECAVTHHHEHGTHQAPHDEGPPSHSHDGTHDSQHEHCASASFVATEAVLLLPAAAASERAAGRAPFAAAFIPDHLDPPPLRV